MTHSPREIAEMMVHSIPGLPPEHLETDILNQKWHHVARTIAQTVVAQTLDVSVLRYIRRVLLDQNSQSGVSVDAIRLVDLLLGAQ